MQPPGISSVMRKMAVLADQQKKSLYILCRTAQRLRNRRDNIQSAPCILLAGPHVAAQAGRKGPQES